MLQKYFQMKSIHQMGDWWIDGKTDFWHKRSHSLHLISHRHLSKFRDTDEERDLIATEGSPLTYFQNILTLTSERKKDMSSKIVESQSVDGTNSLVLLKTLWSSPSAGRSSTDARGLVVTLRSWHFPRWQSFPPNPTNSSTVYMCQSLKAQLIAFHWLGLGRFLRARF